MPSHDSPRQAARYPLHRFTDTAAFPVSAPRTGHDLDAALAAIDAATSGPGPGDDLLRYTGRRMLHAAANANARGEPGCPDLQRALSAWIASGAFDVLFDLSRDDVAALIGAS